MLDSESPHPCLILVVDDDVRTASLLVRMLREDGFEVELATDGEAAIGRLARPPMPSVLVTDLRMPNGDGGSVARFARSHRPEIPVFVVTGYPDRARKLQDSMVPPLEVMAKPIDYPELSAALQRAVNQAARPERTSEPPA
jgi:CheY-like chemotaxis protein